VADRGYLSIGEVLSLLKPEFVDLTISKIRFLESQGLLDPERTPSGYRKFYGPDIERLQWILRQQHENYLPLKVIKGKLGPDGDSDDSALIDAGSPDLGLGIQRGTPETPSPASSRDGSARDRSARDGSARSGSRGESSPRETPPWEASPAEASSRGAAPAEASPRTGSPRAAASKIVASRAGTARMAHESDLDGPPLGVSLTLDELAVATGLSAADLTELVRFGLLVGKTVAGAVYYDAEGLAVANLAAGFMRYGVEARHLRMYKTSAEREAGFLEQVVMPMIKQRNPQARKQALEALRELSQLGQGLRSAMVRQALRDYIGS
jgi:DNA-binding transcriptional MerR regulator